MNHPRPRKSPGHTVSGGLELDNATRRLRSCCQTKLSTYYLPALACLAVTCAVAAGVENRPPGPLDMPVFSLHARLSFAPPPCGAQVSSVARRGRREARVRLAPVRPTTLPSSIAPLSAPLPRDRLAGWSTGSGRFRRPADGCAADLLHWPADGGRPPRRAGHAPAAAAAAVRPSLGARRRRRRLRGRRTASFIGEEHGRGPGSGGRRWCPRADAADTVHAGGAGLGPIKLFSYLGWCVFCSAIIYLKLGLT